ncbi:hypothetical protein, partial [Thermosporothrix hazakensis]
RQVAAWRLLCEGEVSSGGAQVRTVPYFIFCFSHSHAPTSLLSQRVSLIGPLDWCLLTLYVLDQQARVKRPCSALFVDDEHS